MEKSLIFIYVSLLNRGLLLNTEFAPFGRIWKSCVHQGSIQGATKVTIRSENDGKHGGVLIYRKCTCSNKLTLELYLYIAFMLHQGFVKVDGVSKYMFHNKINSRQTFQQKLRTFKTHIFHLKNSFSYFHLNLHTSYCLLKTSTTMHFV